MMKKITFLLFVLLITILPIIGVAAITNTIASGNWSNAGTWDNGVPSNTRDAVIKTGHAVTLDVNVTNPGVSILIEDGGSLTSTGTNGIYIKTNGAFEVYGTMNVYSIDIKNGVDPKYIYPSGDVTVSFLFDHSGSQTVALTVDGSLSVNPGTLANDGVIQGTGTVTATTFTGTGTVFGVSPTSSIAGGTVIGGFTWDGSTSVDWNTSTNWTQDIVPTLSTHDVIIPGGLSNYPNVTTTGNSCRNLIIESGAVLTIAPNAQVDVAEVITNNAGTTGLIIQSTSSGDGSLIFTEGTPSSTVERNIIQGAWHQVACPTDAGNTSNFYDASNDGWLVKHSESTNGWTYITNIDSAISRTQGFDYWVTTSRNVVFTGNLTKDDQPITLDYSGSASNQGWNLLGNPFSSAIKWGTPSWGGNENTSGFVYVYDITYNVTGDYRVSGGDLTNNVIPMGQAFFVKATASGSLTIPKASRLHSSQAFYKSTSATENTQFVRIQLDGANIGNTVFVGFPEFGTSGYDYGGDADKLYSSNETTQIFAVENDKELCINSNAPLMLGESKTVPLHLVQVIEGEYNLSISQLDQLDNLEIILEDLKMGVTQDFRSIPQYPFMASSNDDPNRFLLHFAYSPVDVIDVSDDNSTINIYSYGKDVYIRSTENRYATVTVYDLVGRIVQQQKIENKLEKIQLNISNSYVVVKVVTDETTKTEKVYIK